jgi:hypothetical protein
MYKEPSEDYCYSEEPLPQFEEFAANLWFTTAEEEKAFRVFPRDDEYDEESSLEDDDFSNDSETQVPHADTEREDVVSDEHEEEKPTGSDCGKDDNDEEEVDDGEEHDPCKVERWLAWPGKQKKKFFTEKQDSHSGEEHELADVDSVLPGWPSSTPKPSSRGKVKNHKFLAKPLLKRQRPDDTYPSQGSSGAVKLEATAISQKVQRPPHFSKGDRVEALYESVPNEWFPGLVSRVNSANGVCDILFDDGDSEARVISAHIRYPPPRRVRAAATPTVPKGKRLRAALTKAYSHATPKMRKPASQSWKRASSSREISTTEKLREVAVEEDNSKYKTGAASRASRMAASLTARTAEPSV